MIYSYSQSNLLENPNTYMYTPFQGGDLFESHLSNRISKIKQSRICPHQTVGFDEHLVSSVSLFIETQIKNMSPYAAEMLDSLLNLSPERSVMNNDFATVLCKLAKPLNLMTVTRDVNTLDLLQALVALQLTEKTHTHVKEWLDRLVQRFEVRKKIYEAYLPGFRKGGGSDKSIRLYWFFALALCLYHTKTQGLKYLNALLKICDLLCSLPTDLISKEVPANGLAVVLATEVTCISFLAKKKGISIVSE